MLASNSKELTADANTVSPCNGAEVLCLWPLRLDGPALGPPGSEYPLWGNGERCCPAVSPSTADNASPLVPSVAARTSACATYASKWWDRLVAWCAARWSCVDSDDTSSDKERASGMRPVDGLARWAARTSRFKSCTTGRSCHCPLCENAAHARCHTCNIENKRLRCAASCFRRSSSSWTL